jgi:pyochelin biosynthetic protein PchC
MRKATGRHCDGSAWFEPRLGHCSGEIRLVCFPHAGGSGGTYVECFADLRPLVDVVGVQLPGRGWRSSEPALDSMPALVVALAGELEGDHRTPWLFFGHSFGGALAYAVAERLQRQTPEFPLAALIVSSCPPPHLPSRRARALWQLPRAEFFSELHKLSGLPEDILSNTKLQDWVEPALRADIRARDVWAAGFVAPSGRLGIPIFPVGGTLDPSVPAEDLEGWASYTERASDVCLFEGGHFYFRDEPAPVLARIRSIAERVLTR